MSQPNGSVIPTASSETVLNPFLLACLEPTSPLQHSEVVLRKLLCLADLGLPLVYAAGPIEGAPAPMTPAGSLASEVLQWRCSA